jgi:DNA-binding CsgD family transcriptional regulator
MLNLLKKSTPSISKSADDGLSEEFNLTPREIEMVKYVAEGNSYKQIADRINISDKTVSKHIENIYRKLHVSSKMEVLKIVQKYSDNKRYL